MEGQAMPEVDVRICLNCKEVARFRFLCLDCWRMALLTAALIGGGGETIHQFLERFNLLGP